MGRLAGALTALLLVFATAMSFIALGVYNLQWQWSVLGIAIFVIFVILGGLLVPASRHAVTEEDKKVEMAMLQLFGALCVTLFLTMALVTWALGNRTYPDNNAYQTLGLLLFLAYLAIGIPGPIVTASRLLMATDRARKSLLASG
jgi:peptidoglycan/LPS O-acetylase OafA/YrhL